MAPSRSGSGADMAGAGGAGAGRAAGREQTRCQQRRGAASHSRICLAMISFMISEVPPPMVMSR
jgi:hypothetical protein